MLLFIRQVALRFTPFVAEHAQSVSEEKVGERTTLRHPIQPSSDGDDVITECGCVHYGTDFPEGFYSLRFIGPLLLEGFAGTS